MKAYKISGENVGWLKQYGDTPNQSLNKLREGNPKECLLGNPSESVSLKQSVADLKIKFNSILKEIYNKIQVVNSRLDKVQDDMQEEFNNRLNKFLNNALNNRIETMQETLYKKLKEDIKKG